ncbi:MAG TPA: hypothetical protein ENH62_07970 [Marinobacter sp.]|uniref:Uncharacterized protein n=1 Tax=marine sediment metagenome TaxID=412755 RepID=A0A0F9QGM1_9ZZZZ|nr:hypothetical protein [Marinobacter sp.]
MTIGIKTRNFSPTKTEKTFEQDGLGWAPGYEKKFEGVDIKKERYDKNYSRMVGTCDKCEHFDKTVDKADGSHCKVQGCVR